MGKRQLRISGKNDYVAIDVIERENGIDVIKETIFYFEKDKPIEFLMMDFEEKKWFKTKGTFNGLEIICIDIDKNSDWCGMDYTYKLGDLQDFLSPNCTKKIHNN